VNKSDFMTYRMLHCSECKRAGDNAGPGPFDTCHGTDEEIRNCIDATAPMEEPYCYGG